MASTSLVPGRTAGTKPAGGAEGGRLDVPLRDGDGAAGDGPADDGAVGASRVGDSAVVAGADDAATSGADTSEVGPMADGRPTVRFLVGALFTLWGALIGIRSLSDNSFLTHLATGRLILRTGHIPRSDPYSFTAHGSPWVVQSWLASIAYAVSERLGGLAGIRVLEAVLTAVVAALVWRLTRPAKSLVGRLVVAGVAIGLGTGQWVERPLLMGLVCFALLLVLVDVDSDADLRWLVPIMWVWVNTHGSFPLAPIYLVTLIVGQRLDGQRPTRAIKALGWTLVGTLASVINPLGPKLLLFPATLLQKTQSFKVIKEWQPPQFNDPWQLLFLAQVVLLAALLIRTRKWQIVLPSALFVALAFTAERNIVVASLVLVPAMALAAHDLGSITGAQRPRLGRAALGVIVALGLVVMVSELAQPSTNLHAYPVQAVAWLQHENLLHDRVVAPDFVGNYLEARYNGKVPVFVDDRVDMYPSSLVHDEEILLGGGPRSLSVLRRYRAGVVVWQRTKPLTAQLRRSGQWRVAWQDPHWVVFLPTNPAPAPS